MRFFALMVCTALENKDPKSREIIKPMLRGRDISKYKYEFKDNWIIFTRRGIDIEKYLAIKEYLEEFKIALTPKREGSKLGRKPGQYKWFEIQDNVAYYQDFERENYLD